MDNEYLNWSFKFKEEDICVLQQYHDTSQEYCTMAFEEAYAHMLHGPPIATTQ